MKRFLYIPVLLAMSPMTFFGCGENRAPDKKAPVTPNSPSNALQPVQMIQRTATGAPGEIQSQPLSERQASTNTTLFQRMSPDQTGVHFKNVIDKTHPMKRLYYTGFGCGGVAVGDVDGDGRPDIYLVSGMGSNKLFKQTVDFKFVDITNKAGVAAKGIWSASAAMLDIDNDGDLDIYVSNYDSPNLLYINKGDGSFDERGKAYGLNIIDSSLMSAFADYDNDGDLDCYLLTHRYFREGGRPAKPPFEMVLGKPVILKEFKKFFKLEKSKGNHYGIDEVARPDRLLKNNGNGTFTDVSDEAGISRAGDYGLSVAWWDFNGDGLIDIYIGNDFNDPDHLYRNNGDGTFTNVIKNSVPHTSWFSMGSDAADINNDGRLDFLSVDMSATTHFKQKTSMGAMNAELMKNVAGPPPQVMRNALYVNTGTERFMEAAHLAGLADSDWSWAVKFGDLDNDGLVDVVITNGMARNLSHSDIPFNKNMLIGKTKWDIYENTPPRPEQNLAFRNTGDLRFQDVSRAWGLDHVAMSYAAALSDFDRDGDLDLVVVNLDENVSIYRNATSGDHILVRLEGTVSNSYGIGATVSIETEQGLQIRQLKPHNGFISSNEPLIHFGLGKHAKIKSLTVNWPSGLTQTFGKLERNRFYTITEPALSQNSPAESPAKGQQVLASKTKSEPSIFAISNALKHVVQKERPFNDFARQPLLPNKLSQFGPGMAWGDIDGDGDDDVFVGGPAGETGKLLRNMGKQQFEPVYVGSLDPDSRSEDMSPLFFDADGDGDLDLYIVSGGVECAVNDAALRDRLYLNDGNGKFKRNVNAIPDRRDSGSCVVAADFDSDGDLDLFVGGRSVPGQYPTAPMSRLLRNDNGRFVDVTDEIATGLKSAGMVTSALWSDADGDGDVDLMVTYDWGPVRLWINDKGGLSDHSKNANLSNRLGWWNAIAGGDIDHDGDIDYVVTNFGLNTKYHASKEHPLLIYYGDLDGSGKQRIVEAEFEGSICYPVRGKSCSIAAMPSLGGKFPTFKKFAGASLQDIYTATMLDKAQRFEVNELQSGILVNDGHARFTFRPLPRLAQISPGFGVILADIDGDNHIDACIAQNFFNPQAETGRMGGGLSLLLKGDGKGDFTPVWPRQSGIAIPHDAKSLCITDLNADGRPDLVFGINNMPVMTFVNANRKGNRSVVIQLKGKSENRVIAGSRVTAFLRNGSKTVCEIYQGGGYLSQSGSQLFLGLGKSNRIDRIEIRWPDGKVTNFKPDKIKSPIIIYD